MRLLCLLCAVMCLVALGVAQEASVTCREPTSIAEMYRTLRTRTIEAAAELQEEESTVEDHQHHHVTTTALNHTCHHDQQARVCNCPARHELNFDPSRIPKALVQTRCCSENQESISHWITKCDEVYGTVRVLRRTGCSDGVFSYSLQWERVSVGCSCHVFSNVFSAP